MTDWVYHFPVVTVAVVHSDNWPTAAISMTLLSIAVRSEHCPDRFPQPAVHRTDFRQAALLIQVPPEEKP